jgi:nucleoside-diphosphate-sugar epimerase
MAKKHAVVVGGLGVIGRALVDHLTHDSDWDVVALSRRAPDFETTARFVSVDLSDHNEAREKLAELDETTHVFYAAYQAMPTFAEEVAPNVALLANAVDALVTAAPGLRHVNLMEGGKWYGCHLGPFRTPAVDRPAAYAAELLLRPAGLVGGRRRPPRLHLVGAAPGGCLRIRCR